MNTLEMQPPTCYNLNMSAFISIGILILAMLILAFLQLTPGVYALSYHYAFGKYSKIKSSYLMLFFIIGVEVISACIFLSIYYLLSILFFDNFKPETSIFTWILSGILIALGFFSFFYYFRRGNGTKLFIPRRYTKALELNANSIKTRSDAFVLGALSNACEFLFTLPLYIIASVEIMRLDLQNTPINLFAIMFVLSPLIPLFIIRYKFQAGQTLADIIKSRNKNKFFTRLILATCFSLIAILIICFRTIY